MPSTTTETSSTIKIGLTGKDLLHYMGLPHDAYDIHIFVKIPGGGDYSNMNLDITDEYGECVEVHYKTRSKLPSWLKQEIV